MNKRMYIPASLLLLTLLLAGCGFGMVSGSGKITTETRPASGFTSMTLAGIGNVYVTQGETDSVRIEAEENLIPYFETSVQGTTLTIGVKDQYRGVIIKNTLPIKFYVTMQKVEALTLAGSGDIFAKDIKAEAFKVALLGSGNILADSLAAANVNIQLSGSGNIKLGSITADEVTANLAGSGNIQVDALTTKKVSSKTTGSGNITISGKSAEQSIEIVGSGDYRASKLQSETATVRVAGSGNSLVWVTGTLDVNILGSGDVSYSGSPKVNANIAGSGKVSAAGK